MKILKGLGLGIVYILISPFLLAGTILCLVFGVVLIIFSFFGGIIRFFKGEPYFKQLEEDVIVNNLLNAQHEKLINPKEERAVAEPVNGPTYIQNNYYTDSKNETLPNGNRPTLNNSPRMIQSDTNQITPQIPVIEVKDDYGFDDEPFYLSSSEDDSDEERRDE